MSSWKSKLRKMGKVMIPIAIAGTVGASRKGAPHGILNPQNVKAGSKSFGQSIGSIFGGLFGGVKEGYTGEHYQGNPKESQGVQEEKAANQPTNRPKQIQIPPQVVRGQSKWSLDAEVVKGVPNIALYAGLFFLAKKMKWF